MIRHWLSWVGGLTIALVLIAIGNDLVFRSSCIHSTVYWQILFFAIQSFITSALVGYSIKEFPDYLHIFYLGATVIRFFLTAGVIAAFIFIGNYTSFTFVINFLIMYLLYMGFEINSLLTNLRPNSDNGDERTRK